MSITTPQGRAACSARRTRWGQGRCRCLHLRMKLMPRVPRSITRDTAPVWRLRWKARSMPCRWEKTRAATLRIAPWVTCESETNGRQ